MLDSLITKMRIKVLDKKSYEIDVVIETIKNNIEDNFDLLEKSYEHEYNEKLNKNELLKCFDIVYDDKDELGYKNEFGYVSNYYSPYGIVGIDIKNDITLYNLANILSLIIQSKNSCIVNLYRQMGTQNVLIELINQCLEEFDGINKIELFDDLDTYDNLDLLVYIGNKEEFNKIKSNCNKRFYGIGKYELIVQSELDTKLLNEAKKQNVVITYKDDDLDFYNKYNRISNNYCVSIMTNDKKEAKVFLDNIKSSYSMVNIIPTLEKRINISYYDLVYKKSNIIFNE